MIIEIDLVLVIGLPLNCNVFIALTKKHTFLKEIQNKVMITSNIKLKSGKKNLNKFDKKITHQFIVVRLMEIKKIMNKLIDIRKIKKKENLQIIIDNKFITMDFQQVNLRVIAIIH